MKNGIIKKLAQTLSLFALLGFGSSAYADIITIDFDETSSTGGSYTWNGFVFNGVQAIASADCDDSVADNKCINLAAGNDVTLEYKPEGQSLSFDLQQFYYYVNNSELTVDCTDDPDAADTKCADLVPVSFTGGAGPSAVEGTATNDGDFGGALASILSVTFSKTVNSGRISLDTFKMAYTPPPVDPCIDDPALPECNGTTVPEPGTLSLLGLGLLGLAARRRRKV